MKVETMDLIEYSKKTIIAFFVFFTAFALMVGLLWWINKYGAICYIPIDLTQKPDIFSLLTTLPFVALYLIVLLGATAGYARSSIMSERLPIARLFETELQKHSMKSASVKTKVRSGGQIKTNDSFRRALDNLISSRVPILAVIEGENKVTGVITGNDLAHCLQNELDKTDAAKPLEDRLAEIKVGDLEPRLPVVAVANENLREVAEKMIRNQFTKLIVVEDTTSMKFAGTVDVLDLIGEIFSADGENNER